MKGGIYTKEKCPICGEKFASASNGLFCPVHKTTPKRFYIQIYSRELHKHINVSSVHNAGGQDEPFSSYEQADRILTKMRAEIDAGNFEASRYVAQKLKPLRFKNYSEQWLEKKRIEMDTGKKAPSYIKSLQAHIRHHQQPFFRDTDIRDIKTKRIYEFYLSLKQAPHYIKNILDTLENMLGDAFDWGEIKETPKFPVVDIPEPEKPIIDLEEQDKVIEAIPNLMDKVFILISARLMLRPCEPRALQWADFDFKHDWVYIKRHFSLNTIRPATKGRHIKRLPINNEIKETILSLPRHINSPFVFWKGKEGRPYPESYARKLWKKVAQAMNIHVSLYQGTRHSSATEAADRVGLDATQEFLGHTSRAMTKRYVQANPERLRKVLRK